MILEKLSLINYKNIAAADLELSPKMNCLVGHNGVGKTNVLDAVYFLSFCRSATNPVDSQVIRHEQEFTVMEGVYGRGTRNEDRRNEERGTRNEEGGTRNEDRRNEEGGTRNEDRRSEDRMTVSCGIKRGQKKHFKKDKKEYKRLSEHIGLIPLVMVSPGDTLLVEGGSEERRRLMDVVIAQLNRPYMEVLNRYNKALLQRNTLLKQEEEPDADVMDILEEQMAEAGEQLFGWRTAFVEALTPVFQSYYERISSGREQVSLTYSSHCQRGPLLDVIRRDRFKDRAIGYSLHGIHRDDLEMMLDGHPMKREGSQGQLKTYVIALKLALFELLKRSGTTPLLLLDDIFDKLDAERVEQIVKLVGGDEFGQIFITDTNRDHLDRMLAASAHDYKIFEVENGEICLSATSNH